mgnify:CR=1 FL=1
MFLFKVVEQVFINNKSLLQNTTLMETVYHNYRNEDGFLYISYSGENTFGFLSPKYI